MTAGRILLQNGGEISRVEQTMAIIFSYFGVRSYDIFVMSNAIFVTIGNADEEDCSQVLHVPLASTHLGRVTAVNSLSREIVDGSVSLEEAAIRLKEIEAIPVKSNRTRIAAAGLGSGCFSYLLGGSALDSLAAAGIAFVLYAFLIWMERIQPTKIVLNILGGGIITILASIVTAIFRPLQIEYILIGSIMPLIPGVAFINSIRNFADSDFLSGTIRMIDAILAFVSIAIGVGSVLGLYHFFTGGTIL